MTTHPQFYEALSLWANHWHRAAMLTRDTTEHTRCKAISANYAMLKQHYERDLDLDQPFGTGLVSNAKSAGLMVDDQTRIPVKVAGGAL